MSDNEQEFEYSKSYNEDVSRPLENIKYKGILQRGYFVGDWRGWSKETTTEKKGTFCMASLENIKGICDGDYTDHILERGLLECAIQVAGLTITELRERLPFTPQI